MMKIRVKKDHIDAANFMRAQAEGSSLHSLPLTCYRCPVALALSEAGFDAYVSAAGVPHYDNGDKFPAPKIPLKKEYAKILHDFVHSWDLHQPVEPFVFEIAL